MNAIRFRTSILLLLCLLLTGGVAAAPDQQNAYRDAVARIKAEVAAMPFPEFRIRKIPPEMAHQSEVVLADYSLIQGGVLPASKRDWMTFRELNRVLVAVQDAAAVKSWSENRFLQFNTRNTGYGTLQSRIILHVRIYKPDGSVSEMNPDEDEVRNRYSIGQGVRFAIPDLQPGDVLDYCLVREWEGAPANFGVYSYQFSLRPASLKLNRRVECETGGDFALEYHNINGAPAFETEDLGKGHWKLRFFADSLQPYQQDLPFLQSKREYPYLQLNVMRGDIPPYTSLTRRRPGTISKDPSPERFLWDKMIWLSEAKHTILRVGAYIVQRKSSGVSAFFDSLGRVGRGYAQDSLAADLYYMYRFDFLFNQTGIWGPKTIASLNRSVFNPELFHYLLSEYFKIHNLDAEVILAAPLSEPPLKDVIDARDYVLMTAIRADHDILFGAQHVYAPAFSTVREIEGVPDAIAVNTRDDRSVLGSGYTTRPIAIPFSDATQNLREEQLSLLPDPDCSGLRVARSTRLNGHNKDGVQDRLLTVEEFYNYERQFYKDTRSLEERVVDRKEPGTIASELKAALEKVRAEQKDRFEQEAKTWIYPELTELQQATIRNPGTRHTDPEFQFSSRFRANGLMRPAGNNFMLHIGELANALPDVKPEHRDRKETAYLPYANTYRASYSIRVPDGFTAAGVDALNRQVSNEYGQFEAKASLDDRVVTISLELVCRETMYTPSEWGKLAAVLDAAQAWKNSRILFRRAS